jgi:hypothetical protein
MAQVRWFEGKPVGLDEDKAYRVAGWGEGIAFRYIGPEVERYWDLDEGSTPEDPDERLTGRVQVVMVGDDRVWNVDPEDLTELAEDEFCRGCGQIGCTAYVSG